MCEFDYLIMYAKSKQILFILFLLTISTLIIGCTQKTTKNVENTTNKTTKEIESHDIFLDEPLIIDAEKETVTLNFDTGIMTKTLKNESNRTIVIYPKPKVNTTNKTKENLNIPN